MIDAYYRRGVCYCCEREYTTPHHFYREMCKECGEFNYQKRMQRLDLSGYHALVTGGRIKIGFETARLLLEMGADVTVTSRFPNDTYKRYEKLENFSSFKDRLHIIGADFRSLEAVSHIVKVMSRQPLDILINNAAQTVRKPAPFYKHLLAAEKQMPALPNILAPALGNALQIVGASLPAALKTGAKKLSSAEMSQLPVLPEDCLDGEHLFPSGQYDKDGQQIDLRDNNSWMYELEDVSVTELYEVLQINLVVPFLLNTKLIPVLKKTNRQSYIINVSAMEGNFYAPRKHSRHAHTNMAKAALNMMTRTAAGHYKDMGIYMNSVDTGWITNEKPNPGALGADERKTLMAIDEVDGAMRVLDPVLSAIDAKALPFGKLFKNYKEYPW